MGRFSLRTFVRTFPHLGHPARPKAQPARPEAWLAGWALSLAGLPRGGQTDRLMNGNTPHSTGLRPLKGPLPKNEGMQGCARNNFNIRKSHSFVAKQGYKTFQIMTRYQKLEIVWWPLTKTYPPFNFRQKSILFSYCQLHIVKCFLLPYIWYNAVKIQMNTKEINEAWLSTIYKYFWRGAVNMFLV